MSSPNGPQAGSTPPDADELSGNPSPFHTGETLGNVTQSASSQYQLTPGGVPGYWNNPVADPDNPYHAGSGSYTPGERQFDPDFSDDVLFQRNLGYGVPADAADPNHAADQRALSIDTGQDDQLVPPNEQR